MNQNTENGFKNDILSLFQKDFIKMASYSKVEYRRKKKMKNENRERSSEAETEKKVWEY